MLYVNGEVDAEKPLPPSLLYQRAGSAASGADIATAPIEDFNPSPLFVGQPPSYATGEKGAEGLLQGLVRHGIDVLPLPFPYEGPSLL